MVRDISLYNINIIVLGVLKTVQYIVHFEQCDSYLNSQRDNYIDLYNPSNPCVWGICYFSRVYKNHVKIHQHVTLVYVKLIALIKIKKPI